ncbi:MAG: hypothetical protein K8S54_11865 [Spirochaetia bacterium]|nr:hypothetical protein [Spirochaetia bacterium]
MRRLCAFLLFLIAAIVQAETTQSRPLNVAVYQGLYSDTALGEILLSGKTHYRPSYITTLAVGRSIDWGLLGVPLEAEGQIVRHTGVQKHLEFNGLFLLRSDAMDLGLPVTFAVAEGLSVATRNPDLENQRKSIYNGGTTSEYSRNFLNYLAFEIEARVPVDAYQPRAFLRVHHRSGIYGLLCPPTCGSNYMAYGMRFTY